MSLNRFFRQEELRWILPKSPWEDWDDYDEELALMVESEEKHVIEVECRPHPEVDPDIEKRYANRVLFNDHLRKDHDFEEILRLTNLLFQEAECLTSTLNTEKKNS